MPFVLLVAALAAPTAIVDSVDGVPGIAPLDLLPAGTELALGDDARIRLAYFASCLHETVRGGRVVIGVLGSLVDGGVVTRASAECELPRGPGGGLPGALILRGGRNGVRACSPQGCIEFVER